MKKFLLIVSAVILFLTLDATAARRRFHKGEAGEKLVRQIWGALKENDIQTIERMMARGFQALHQDGASSVQEELKLIRNYRLRSFKLAEIEVTGDDRMLVVTYSITGIGKFISSTEPGWRMDVFVNEASGWKWLAHANIPPRAPARKTR